MVENKESVSALKSFKNRIPDAVWAPLTTAILMLIVGALGMAFNKPWLFPSLVPTAYLQGETQTAFVKDISCYNWSYCWIRNGFFGSGDS